MNLQTYIDLIPSQNRAMPKFAAMVAATMQPFVDGINLLSGIPALFDIDTAVGVQLDVIGQWVGVARKLSTALVGVYFSWDVPGAGWDQASWKLPTDPSTGVVVLSDKYYRAVLKAKILNNQWDGDVQDAYTIMNATFASFGYSIGIEDLGNLTIALLLIGPTKPDSELNAIFLSGLLDIRPIGVQVINRAYVQAPVPLLDSTFVLDTSIIV